MENTFRFTSEIVRISDFNTHDIFLTLSYRIDLKIFLKIDTILDNNH